MFKNTHAGPRVTGVPVTDEALTVALTDGRQVSVPLGWYPRLAHATVEERNQWKLIGRGSGIHWPAVDEDVSVASFVAGSGSSESQTSLQKWLATHIV